MKARKFNRKLQFNKRTIANLKIHEMTNINGGGTTKCVSFDQRTIVGICCIQPDPLNICE